MHEAADLTSAYHDTLQRHGYAADYAQLNAIARLEDLRRGLVPIATAGRGWFDRLLRRAAGTENRRPRGVYLYGDVGRGKTFLMDLFHGSLAVPSRRQHFHRFMRDVHDGLREARDVEDPLARVAAAIAAQARVLCLDELFVSDIADAMILSGLFSGLDERGVVLVFTSNAPPSELYRDGLQRSRFLPAIALLERRCELVNVDAGTDYRLRALERAPLYFDSAGDDVDARLAARFEAIAGGPGETGGVLQVEGRAIGVRRQALGVAWFDFADICCGPRATADYVEIARDFHSVIVSGVPVFDAGSDNEARRFIALVDEFYDRAVKLVVSAAAGPDGLYRGERLAFEFARTRSRLAEMQTHAYLGRPHRP